MISLLMEILEQGNLMLQKERQERHVEKLQLHGNIKKMDVSQFVQGRHQTKWLKRRRDHKCKLVNNKIVLYGATNEQRIQSTKEIELWLITNWNCWSQLHLSGRQRPDRRFA